MVAKIISVVAFVCLAEIFPVTVCQPRSGQQGETSSASTVTDDKSKTSQTVDLNRVLDNEEMKIWEVEVAYTRRIYKGRHQLFMLVFKKLYCYRMLD